ncbi:MAG TPA: hypothetical protein PKD54_05855 [Pirellulaceae bacterium]|nr:hypothetical protein [Pirellulaceae bacterium]
MSAAQTRNQRIEKLHKVARRLYSPVAPPSHRTLLEHLIYACCLEDSKADAADEVFAKLQVNYYDWNEVRVTTTAELAQLMKGVTDPEAAAIRVRKSLQGLFEAHYSFDIDALKKENLGKAQELIAKYRGVSPFGLSYVTQHALGGHSIPLDRCMLSLLFTVGVISAEEQAQGKAPGLERTIPKNKGIEFASVTHQLAVDFAASPFNPNLRKTLLQIDPTASERFPKRGGSKAKEPEAPERKPKETKSSKAATKPSTAKPAAKPTTSKKKGPPKKEIRSTTKNQAKSPTKGKPKTPLNRISKRKPR